MKHILDENNRSELSKIYVHPTRIMWHNDGAVRTDCLEHNSVYQSTVNESGTEIRVAVLNPGGAVLVDFGKELCGGIKILSKRVFASDGSEKKQCSMRLRFGESAGEAMAELGEKNTTNDHSPRDFSITVSILGMSEYGQTGFRFVRIDNIDEENSVEIAAVCACANFRDIEYKGTFRSSDGLLNKIFDTAAYTLHLCMQDYIWDGIKRDRVVWIGDMYPEIAALCSVFGFDSSVEKSLDLVRDVTAPDGYMNGIITYSAWWLLIQHRWYMQNARMDYLREQHKTIIDIVNLFAKHIGKDGMFDPGDAWALFDWPSNYSKELSVSGVHSIVKWMFDCGAFLLDELGDGENSAFCREKAEVMKKVSLPDFDYKQIAAMHVLAGFKDAKTENKRLLSKKGATGISTFLGMFTFAAQSEAGDTERALENIRGLYGKMLELGATSFWEDFDPAWCENAGRIDELTPAGLEDIHGDRGAYCYIGFRHSLCHGWSSGVCAYMSEYLLGIKIKAPGCREIEIIPNKSDLDFVEGTYPTPYGIISVRHEKNSNGEYVTTYTAPQEIKVTVREAV